MRENRDLEALFLISEKIRSGFNEDQILSLCDYSFCGYSDWKYWTSEIYSFGYLIRKYGLFPRWLPLYVYSDHSPGVFTDEPAKHELESDAVVQFYHSKRMVDAWKRFSDKPCYAIYSPYAFYRRISKVYQSLDAVGTIAFPAHTTPSIEDCTDIEEYIKQLKEMPSEFQPVTVCLHMHDIIKGQHKIFMKHGIPVITAGNTSDVRFVDRFYSILKSFKYSTSNMIGAYTYYSVEMGIPFSIYGVQQKFVNHDDENITMGDWDPYNEYPFYKKLYDLFLGMNKEISKDQKEIIDSELGINDGLSRLEMMKVLYAAYFKRGNFLSDVNMFMRFQLKLIKNSTRSFRRKIQALFK